MLLCQGEIGVRYRVVKLHVQENMMRRLEALGVNEGAKIEIMNRKKNGSFIIKVRGTRWAVGKPIAEGIDIVEESLWKLG